MKEGALRKYMKVKYGNKAFDSKGRIKKKYLYLAYKSGDAVTRKRITFALNMEKSNK